MDKYEMTEETMEWAGHELHRIRALRNFANANEGEMGGWIESEANLSQTGDAWIADDAKVFEFARISKDAFVGGNAMVFGNAIVTDSATVHDHALVYEAAGIFGDAKVLDTAVCCETALLSGSSCVGGDAWIRTIYDVFSVSPIGTTRESITFFTNKRKEILVSMYEISESITQFMQNIPDLFRKRDIMEAMQACALAYMHFHE
jgi:hypothetical protein